MTPLKVVSDFMTFFVSPLQIYQTYSFPGVFDHIESPGLLERNDWMSTSKYTCVPFSSLLCLVVGALRPQCGLSQESC